VARLARQASIRPARRRRGTVCPMAIEQNLVDLPYET
jgi:hypothetical protein